MKHSTLMLCCMCFCGCDLEGMTNHNKSVASGFAVIPESVEMEKLYGPCLHFLSSKNRDGTYDWNSCVVIEGRYELTMQQSVKVKRNKVSNIGSPPKFVLVEMEEIEVLRDGRLHISYTGKQLDFGPDEWNRVVDANGDFSVVGYSIVKRKPRRNVLKYIESQHGLHDAIRPPES